MEVKFSQLYIGEVFFINLFGPPYLKLRRVDTLKFETIDRQIFDIRDFPEHFPNGIETVIVPDPLENH